MLLIQKKALCRSTLEQKSPFFNLDPSLLVIIICFKKTFRLNELEANREQTGSKVVANREQTVSKLLECSLIKLTKTGFLFFN